ncbi:MAG: hypothetical protein ACR2KS_10155 [Candidatus Eremiobacter antarcticus]|nr:hypothetical protein [Candidatus Eremiobacteraeota bacterium]MBC5808796.1 hypothetical protein [Candidatus Eremiobacteraeota bacterium]
MPASIPTGAVIVDCAPGETVKIQGAGFGASGSTVLQGQGAASPPIGTLALAQSLYSPTEIDVVIPDGAVSGNLLITAQDNSTVTLPLRIGSKYITSADYVGEGMDVSRLAPGELDTIIRRASTYCDLWIGHPARLLQTMEPHRWNARTRKLWPFRLPIVSIDSLVIRMSPTQVATIHVTDVLTVSDRGYIEVLDFAVLAYSLSQVVMSFGYSANDVELTYTAGYTQLQYPDALRMATVLVVTELLTYRSMATRGLAGLSSVQQGNQKYDRAGEPFAMPAPAKELLLPFRARGIH